VVRYVGLEPDGDLVDRMREKWAWANVQRGDAESIDATAAYDHVLVLRSWNHLHDPKRAVRAILKALRPGGTLTVVDDAPFGLLREPDQAARAEGSRAIFEHHRNDGPDEAARVLSSTPLVALDRLDVGPSTSTLWMLRYRAP
jgi:SAM-dependent methyltransferase